MTPLPEARFPQSLENEEKLGWLVSALDSGYTIPKKCNFGNIDFSFCRTLVVAFIIDHFFHFWNAVVTSGVAFVNSMSSSFSSDSDSSRKSPSLASDEILYFRLNEFSET